MTRMASLAWAAVLAAATSASMAQEIQGGAAATGAPVPKSISVSQGKLDAAGKDGANFLHSNMSYEQTRYYPAAQINSTNVAKLKPAFMFQTEVLESMETAPIVVDGIMFLTTSFNHVYAIDAVTGEEFWHYKQKLGPISKQGDRYLRRILVVGAIAVLRRAQENPGKYPWLTQLLARRPFKVVAVALANKMARMAWALLAHGGTYRAPELAETA